ncbi:GNAT family N-acetyltransferase [Kordia sp. YSTF-M3]|uniref:GNAT family N-acetyltransferase n=1 Tax=Kordia aestuariivivens TaxID=2759037 RepID=A0ABR7Q484_9FLAO|nr:GNAT family N-acetyltransferase [Kordia aestuariivivens]MBC8753374.1 GNAT family N-acetyltransferase [Kordia aestuariivivens]
MNRTIEIELRRTNLNDLETLFVFQLDEEANRLAAFTSKNPSDKNAYIEKWTRLLSDEKVNSRTILLKKEIVGSIAKYEMEGDAEITYWIGKEFWGKGIATSALKKFLEIEKTRPIFGRIAFDNFGSKKVLENCRFSKIGIEKGFANAREKEIEEFIYELK